MPIIYSTSHDGIDWAALKAALAADNFDNGRTAQQMERSFRASFRCVYAFDETDVVGTARALSDGVCNAYIVDMWTHSKHRRRGIGRRMMDTLCEPLAGQHVFSQFVKPFFQQVLIVEIIKKPLRGIEWVMLG